jgi:Ca2+-transporting ATPase
LAILVDQLKNLIALLLAGASGMALLFGQWLDGIAILIALGINILIGFFTELKAVRSMESLRKMTRVSTRVIRNGEIRSIASEELTPGDVVVLEGGDLVPADLRVCEASNLEVDESALTGESVPVPKSTDPVSEDALPADRTSMMFSGTAVTGGSGKGITVAVGMDTEIGKISSMAEEAEQEAAPLENRLDKLGRRLIWITLVLSAGVVIGGILTGRDLFLAAETAIALAVAAVPEGLPIVATIALARGMMVMAERNALVNKLSSVETLGSVNTVCTDKTGTLTENRMTVTTFALPLGKDDAISVLKAEETNDGQTTFRANGDTISPDESPRLKTALQIGVLCNASEQASDEEDQDASGTTGDPLEVALLEIGRKAGFRRDRMLESMPESRVEPFDNDTNMMATFHKNDDGYMTAIKGAPESVIKRCTTVRTDDGDVSLTDDAKQNWLDMNSKMAEEGLRVIALASRQAGSIDEDPYEHPVLTGLVGLEDPPRADVAEAIGNFHTAGIKVIMVTGDQPETAQSIGATLGLAEDDPDRIIHAAELTDLQELSDEERTKLRKASIFSRVTPEQKLDLVELLQGDGSVVAMTGDGVNDAPALKKADVGVAMGRRGKQVAQEAADVVLKDDAFSTIVVAVEHGRAIFHNIRRFVIYLLSGNVAEILMVAVAMALGTLLPIRPLQILYLNMIGDVFPALALGVSKGDPVIMKRPPRPTSEPILTSRHWGEIFAYGIVLAGTVLALFYVVLYRMGLSEKEAVTISFLTISFARIWHTFNMKDWGGPVFTNSVIRNPYVWGALCVCIALLVLAVFTPLLAAALDIAPPSYSEWGIILGVSFLPTVLFQFLKWGPVSRGLGLIPGRDTG